jgi:hypothetical protein
MGISLLYFKFYVRFNMYNKVPLGRPRRVLEVNVRMDLMEIGWEGVDWIHLAQDRDQWLALVNTVMNLRVPKKAGISRLAE